MKGLFLLKYCFILGILSPIVVGQDLKQNRIDISLSAGLSIPIGIFGIDNPSKAAIYANGTQIKGFAKSKCGFAKIGPNYNLEAKYVLSPYMRLLLITGIYSNPVKTKGMSNFLTLTDSNNGRVDENDYRFFYINGGVGYIYKIGKLDFDADFLLGYSSAIYPYYKFVLLWTGDPPVIFAHNGPQPNLSALSIGAQLSLTYSISKHLRAGVNFLYLGSNFKYTVAPMLIPGGGGANLTYSDVLKTHVVVPQIKIGLSF